MSHPEDQRTRARPAGLTPAGGHAHGARRLGPGARRARARGEDVEAANEPASAHGGAGQGEAPGPGAAARAAPAPTAAPGALAWLAARARLGTPGRPTPAVAWALRRVVGPVLRLLYRPAFEHLERLPASGPFLLVANHSGAGQAESVCLALLWLDHHPDRPLVAFAHPLGFHLPVVGWFLRSVGAVPSTRAHALAALRAGLPVLVFPGGDHEAFRPLWEASRVDFGGRRGFLGLARDAGVPVVPLGIRGSHHTVPILQRSRLLPWLTLWPRLLGLKRLPLTVLLVLQAAAVAVVAGPALGPLPTLGLVWASLHNPIAYLLPILPGRIRYAFGAPLVPEALFGPDDPDPLPRAYAAVEGAVQGLVRPPR